MQVERLFAKHNREICGNSSVGRAQPCQGWGREFEPRFPLYACPSGGIGRRARFRCVCREACRFDSCLGHNAFAIEMERWRNGRRAALRWQCREAWEFESPPLHFQCGNSSVGRAQPCQGWGREFEPRFPLHVCPSGGIGRRARFRCVCREACRFDSCLGHKI